MSDLISNAKHVLDFVLHPPVAEWATNMPVLIYFILFTIIFMESGVLLGFVFPGDSLLFTIGLLAAKGALNIWFILPVLTIAAILGDNVGYWTGQKWGRKLFEKEILFFKPKYLHAAERYFHKNGSRAITIGRFVPAVRTFIPIVAGVVGMPRKTFMFYNAAGGIFWVFSITLLGFFLGQIDWVAEMVERQLTLVAIAIIIVSVLIGWFENRHSGVDNEDVTT